MGATMRYRIAKAPDGHYVVLPAPLSVVPISETYATREAAQSEADHANALREANQEVLT